jgi:transcriptional regulator with XRE-family HTH domain
MRDIAELIAENTLRLMAEVGLNQSQLAHKCGLAQPVVNRAVNGKMANPEMETLKALTLPFRKPVSWILTDHKNPTDRAGLLSEVLRGLPALNEFQLRQVLAIVEAAEEVDTIRKRRDVPAKKAGQDG